MAKKAVKKTAAAPKKPAKKAPAKKVVAQSPKLPAKKAPVKKAPAVKPPAANASAVKATIAKTPAAKTPVKPSPVKKLAAAKPAAVTSPTAKSVKAPTEPKLLSGGNPQIAKGYGEAPVQAYIAAMPGWKCELGRRLDAIITRTIPGVNKAVKWNSPLYGVEEGHWFLGLHCFNKYLKVAFFRGASLSPVPPGKSKQKEVRYLDIREEDQLDEQQFVAWVKQASELPGEKM